MPVSFYCIVHGTAMNAWHVCTFLYVLVSQTALHFVVACFNGTGSLAMIVHIHMMYVYAVFLIACCTVCDTILICVQESLVVIGSSV